MQERLEREYDLGLVLSAPSVSYRVTMTDGETLAIDNPSLFPDPARIEYVEEPPCRLSGGATSRNSGRIEVTFPARESGDCP